MPLLQDLQLVLRLRLRRYSPTLVRLLQAEQALVSLVSGLGSECFDSAPLRGCLVAWTGARRTGAVATVHLRVAQAQTGSKRRER